MSYPRKSVAAFAFAVAFVLAIGLTAFLRLRPHFATPEPVVPPPVCVTSADDDTDVPFRVEQAVVDFAEQQSHTTLMLTSRPNEDVPQSVWVWADYYESAPNPAPPVDDGVSTPRFAHGSELMCEVRAVPAVMRLRNWTSRPQQIEVTDGRRLRVVAECPVCDERPSGKPTLYTRIHVTRTPPDRATIERKRDTQDPTNITPVIVQGTDE